MNKVPGLAVPKPKSPRCMKCGQRVRVSLEEKKLWAEAIKAGASYRKVAEAAGVTPALVHRYVKEVRELGPSGV